VLPPFAESPRAIRRDADVVRHPRKAGGKREGREEEEGDGGSPLAPSRPVLYLQGAPERPDECVGGARAGVRQVLRRHLEALPQFHGQGDLLRQCPLIFRRVPPTGHSSRFFIDCDEGLPLSRRFLQ
jgi:hypothetical protein